MSAPTQYRHHVIRVSFWDHKYQVIFRKYMCVISKYPKAQQNLTNERLTEKSIDRKVD